MTSPLRMAILGGASMIALCGVSVAVASASSTTPTTTTDDGGKAQRIMVVGAGDEQAGFGGDRGPGMGHRGGDPERMARRLRDVLQLTPAQEPALQAFLAAMHPSHEGSDRKAPGGERMHNRGQTADPAARKAEMDQRLAEIEKMRAEEAALTTPQRLDRMVMKMAERAARRQAELQAHVAAIKQFYAALTPSQQKAFDALHGGMMGGMGGMGGMGDEPGGRKMHLGLIDGPAPSLPPIPPLAVRAPRSPAPLAPPLPPEPPLPAY